MYTKQQCLEYGLEHIKLWMDRNNIPPIPVYQWKKGDRCYYLKSCAFYIPKWRCRDNGLFTQQAIHIMVDKCQQVDSGSVGGRNWSFPGYVIDRTPYGVLAHELGHYIEDRIAGVCDGWFSKKLRLDTEENPITSYHPNDGEWFAEIFRLFVTNPNLLQYLRPRMFNELITKFPVVAENRTWQEVLAAAPRRTQSMAQRKILEQGNETMNEDEQR